jgi:high-affinity iron transporter
LTYIRDVPTCCLQLRTTRNNPQESPTMLAALLIVFREVMEAGLIVGIVLAATRGVPGRIRLVTLGVLAGLLGAGLLAVFAGQLAALFDGAGSEVFQASVLGCAVLMLAWHTIWMASHGREVAREMRALGSQISRGAKPPSVLGVVVAIAVLREGSEVVLFLYGIAVAGGTTEGGMAVGGALGVAAGVALTWLVYRGLLAIPTGKMLTVTGWLIMLVAAGMASQAVAFLQQGGYADVLAAPLWDTRFVLSEGSLLGRLAHTLVGYSDQPDGLQLIAYGATLGLIWAAARAVRSGTPPRTARAAAE